ncbi:MAG: hypothetical protein ACC628_06535 [Pirellulaceae bacterium]
MSDFGSIVAQPQEVFNSAIATSLSTAVNETQLAANYIRCPQGTEITVFVWDGQRGSHLGLRDYLRWLHTPCGEKNDNDHGEPLPVDSSDLIRRGHCALGLWCPAGKLVPRTYCGVAIYRR